MNFDIRTLSIITALSAVVFAFAMITVARLVPGERYLKCWAWGTSMAAVSTFLVGLRGVWPDLITIVVANTAMACAFVFFYRGMQGLVGRAQPGAAWWGIAVLACLGLAWFTLVQPDLPARVLLMSVVIAPLLTLMAVALWRYDRQNGPSPLRVANTTACVILGLGVLLFVGRLFPTYATQGVTSYTQSTSALFVAPYLWATLFNVWLAIFVTLTVSARLQQNLVVARDAAEAHSVAKSQFLANMSHEIRTPMNAILGLLQLLQATELNTRQKDYTDKTQGAARSLLGLINDILDFSKVEAGKMVLDPQAFSLSGLMQSLSVVLLANVGDKKINVRFDLDPAVPPLLVGDSLRLQQVLLNLGGNAIKFTDQGQVVLSVRLQSLQDGVAHLAFAVQDSGIGIAPEHQAHVFTGFSQAEASTTRRFGGTGLGLAISQRLVSLMGGQLVLTSALGQGSTFTFRLDLPVASVSALPVPPASDGGARGQRRLQGMRILVVEDNPINQQVAQELLRAEGAMVSLAGNGELGLEAVASARPAFDAVLMDVQMPVMDGLEATRAIRQQLGMVDLPVIAMTANAMASDRADCLAAGMNDHVGKPFDLAQLVALLRHYVPENRAGAVSAPLASPVVAPSPSPPGMGHIIDLDAALARMAGLRPLYVAAAGEFVKDLPTMVPDLRRWVDADLPQAARLLHTLKGTAALVGATDLAQQAARLERLCERPWDAAQTETELQALALTVQRTQVALQELIARMERP